MGRAWGSTASNGYHLRYPNEDFILYPAFSSNIKKDNPLAFWLKKRCLPSRRGRRPGPSDPSLNVPRSCIMARFSYIMCSTRALWLNLSNRRCSTLALWLDYGITCAPLLHSGLIIVSTVLHSRILAGCQ
jgi:hypothetical protein